MKRLLVALLFVLGVSQFANAQELTGTWKLVDFQTVFDNEPPRRVYGDAPKGVLVLTKEGRMIAIITAQNRQSGMGDAERVNLHKTMIAYSGTYVVKGNEFVTTVDVSWNEGWNGTSQKRFWKIEDGKLFIEAAPGPSPGYPGRTSFGRLIWERER